MEQNLHPPRLPQRTRLMTPSAGPITMAELAKRDAQSNMPLETSDMPVRRLANNASDEDLRLIASGGIPEAMLEPLSDHLQASRSTEGGGFGIFSWIKTYAAARLNNQESKKNEAPRKRDVVANSIMNALKLQRQKEENPLILDLKFDQSRKVTAAKAAALAITSETKAMGIIHVTNIKLSRPPQRFEESAPVYGNRATVTGQTPSGPTRPSSRLEVPSHRRPSRFSRRGRHRART